MADGTTESKTSNAELSYSSFPQMQALKRQSTIIRARWLEDYSTQQRRGIDDITGGVKFNEIELDIGDLKITEDECILIIPQISAHTRRASSVHSPEKVKQLTKHVLKASKENDSSETLVNENNDKDDSYINSPRYVKTYKTYRLPVLHPSVGHSCIDVRALFGNTNITTYDPGFMSTASCHSEITYIDGPKGTLLHRGYPIEEVCDNLDFVELSFLLLYGDLPNKTDLTQHVGQLKRHTMVHEKLIQFYKGFRYNAHPMAIMCAVVGAMSSFYHAEMDIKNADHRLICAYRLIAKMPTLAAMAYKTSIGEPIVYPKNKFSYAENFLHMLFELPSEEYNPHPTVIKALDTFLMLHADHEQNASTSTVRIAGSSHANPFACIASGITALWGPAHGGANEAVLNMLAEIGHKNNINKFIEKAKDKKDPFRLMGFGHRVYKNYDPRAKVMQKICHQLLKDLKIIDDQLLELAMELEKVALNDEYFKKRKLFPNVDFYSGIVLKAMGIPTTMFTVLFAVARTVGWISHWKEMIEDPKQRIGRPRQLYLGMSKRHYVPIDERQNHNGNGNGNGNANKNDNVTTNSS